MLGSYCSGCNNCRRQLEALEVPLFLDLNCLSSPGPTPTPETSAEASVVVSAHHRIETQPAPELMGPRAFMSVEYATHVVAEAGRPDITATDALHSIDDLARHRAQQQAMELKHNKDKAAIETLSLIEALEEGHARTDNSGSRITVLDAGIGCIEALRDINGLALRKMYAKRIGAFRDPDADRVDALQLMDTLENRHAILGGKRIDFTTDDLGCTDPPVPDSRHCEVRRAAVSDFKTQKQHEQPATDTRTMSPTLAEAYDQIEAIQDLSLLDDHFEPRRRSNSNTLEVDTNTLVSSDRDSSGSIRIKGPLTTDLLRKLMAELESPVTRAPQGDNRSTTAEVLALLEEHVVGNQVESPHNQSDGAHAPEDPTAPVLPLKRPPTSQIEMSCAPLRLRRQKTKRFDFESSGVGASRTGSFMTQADSGNSPESRSPSDKSCTSGTTTRTSHDSGNPFQCFKPGVVTTDSASFRGSHVLSLKAVRDDFGGPLKRSKPYVVTANKSSFLSSRVLGLNAEQVDSEPKRHSVTAEIEVSTPDIPDDPPTGADRPEGMECGSDVQMEKQFRSPDFDTDHAHYDDSGDLDHALFSPVFDHIIPEVDAGEDFLIQDQRDSLLGNLTSMNCSMVAQHQLQIQLQKQMQSKFRDQIQEYMQFAQAQMTSQVKIMQMEMQTQLTIQQEQMRKMAQQPVSYASGHHNSRLADQEAQIIDLTADCAALQAENARIRAETERAKAELAHLRSVVYLSPSDSGTDSSPDERSYPVSVIQPVPLSRLRNRRQYSDSLLANTSNGDAFRSARSSSLQHRRNLSSSAQQQPSISGAQLSSTIFEGSEQYNHRLAEAALPVFEEAPRSKSQDKDKDASLE